MIADLCEKLCESVVQGETQTKQRKQKKKKKHGTHNETSAGIDDEETCAKKKPPNYFVAIQVSNPEVQYNICMGLISFVCPLMFVVKILALDNNM